MDRPSKEHILREIRRLAAENDGKPPGVRNFLKDTGIGQSEWSGRYWARWSDAVREAGFAPGEWGKQILDDNALLRVMAELTREYGHPPTVPELRMRKRTHPDMPGSDTIRRRFGERAILYQKLIAFADADPEFADVREILASTAPKRQRKIAAAAAPDAVVTGVVYLIRMGEFYKIGKSNDPGRRMYELGLRLPEKHDVIHVIDTDDPSGIESYWHRRFASQRANGEWFRLSPDDVKAMKRRTYM